MRECIWTIAAGLTGVVLYGATTVRAGASPSSESAAVAAAQTHVSTAAVAHERSHAAPPVLLAHTIVPATPVIAVQTSPAVAGPGIVAQGSIVRTVTPNGSQPGVLWLMAIGAVLYRMGARVLRVS